MTTTRKMNPVCITHSELNVLRNCAWKHHLRYELSLDPVGGGERTGARSVGSLVHLGIAQVYRTIQSMQVVRLTPSRAQLSAVVRATLDEAVKAAQSETDLFEGDEADELARAESADQETAARCLDLFVEHIALPALERYDVLGVEVPFRVPILTTAGKRSGDELEGVIDIVLRDRALGTIVCGENKTTSYDASTYELKLATDPQMPLYIYALKQMFGDAMVKGAVLLNVIRKAYPSEPRTNQDGTISIAEVDTTRDVYEEALQMQVLPEWLTKARAALEDAQKEHRLAAGEGKLDEKLTKRLEKAQESWDKVTERWDTLRAKQAARRDGLPTISRFVSQFEEHISDEHVRRAALDAWNGARLVRLFRREQLTPWRNGSACKLFNRLCDYHDACVEGIVEPGDLLVKREARHAEVEEAAAHPQPDMLAIMARLDG